MTVQEFDAKVAAAIDAKFKTALETLSKDIPAQIAEVIKDTLSDQAALTKENAKGLPVFVVNKDKPQPGTPEFEEKGLNFGKVIRAMATTRFAQQPLESSIDVLKSWGDTDAAKAVEEAQAFAKAQQAGNPIAGGYLVPPAFSTEVIEFLRPMSIVRAAGPRNLPMNTLMMSMSRVTEGSVAYYIGETQNIKKTELEFGQLTIHLHKLAALIPISNDLLRFSNPGADAIVRDDVVQAMAQRENATFLRGRGSNQAPKGIRYWVADDNVLEADGSTELQNVTFDLSNAILALLNNNIPMIRPCWMMAPRTLQFLATIQNGLGNYAYRDEILNGRLWGYPVKVSTEMPITLAKSDTPGTIDTSEIYLIDMNDAILAEGMAMSVDTSGEASYKDGSENVSTFQRDETVIRVMTQHDFVMRRRESIAVLRDVRWGV